METSKDCGKGDKHYVTPHGREVGGEFRMSKGPYFLWPIDLSL